MAKPKKKPVAKKKSAAKKRPAAKKKPAAKRRPAAKKAAVETKPPAEKMPAAQEKASKKAAGESPKTLRKPADPLPLPGLDETLRWIGEPVDDSGGQRIGKVSGIFADAGSAEPKWLVVRLGIFGGDAAIPIRHVAEGGGRVWAAYDREEVRGSPKLSADQSLNAGQELQLCEHYGIRIGIGRAAEVAEREGDEVTAVPAA